MLVLSEKPAGDLHSFLKIFLFHFIKLIKKQSCIYFCVQPTFLKQVFWECCSLSWWSTWRWRITAGRISASTSAARPSCHQTLAKGGKENHILSKKPWICNSPSSHQALKAVQVFNTWKEVVCSREILGFILCPGEFLLFKPPKLNSQSFSAKF